MTEYSELLKLDLLLGKAQCSTNALPLLSQIQSLYFSGGRSNLNTTKIYIGYMPVTTNEASLRQIFHKYCQVSQVMYFFYFTESIKKGNAQGHFDKFCYGFVTMNVPEKQAENVINRITKDNPTWKLKIKQDGPGDHARGDKYLRQNNYPPQPQPNYQPSLYHLPPPPQMQPQMMTISTPHPAMTGTQPPQPYNRMATYNNYPQQPQNDKGQIYGEKKNRIMVRQLWLGGIPQMIDHNKMTEVMSKYGIVEATEIFPKFAFVKYKKAVDAAIAYERAEGIYEIFGKNVGFRIAFSDPSRRKQIVGNNYQFQKSCIMLPVLFLGFPPITSANVDINHMLNVCQKYGQIVNYYLKKSTNAQMRSYFLFTYDSQKNALRAKNELCRRKDLLGQKRVQITLLLDEQSVIKGRDFSYTQQHFINDQGFQKKKPINTKPGYPQGMSNYNNIYQHSLIPGNYMIPNSINNYGYPTYGQTNNTYTNPNLGFYYPTGYEHLKQPQKNMGKASDNNDFFEILQYVYEDRPEQKRKGPQKKPNEKQQNTSEIICKMLGRKLQPNQRNSEQDNQGEIHDNDHGRNEQPNWSGFITWKGVKRALVDAFAKGQSDFSDYNINISSVVCNDDVILKDKFNIMVLVPTNAMNQSIFNEYLKVFKKRVGISVTKNWLIYIMGKNNISEAITPLKDSQLLVVMEKASISQQLKDKFQPCNDSYFE